MDVDELGEDESVSMEDCGKAGESDVLLDDAEDEVTPGREFLHGSREPGLRHAQNFGYIMSSCSCSAL